MQVSKAAGQLADPTADGWAGIEPESVSLTPVPLDAQPTEYIQVTWADKQYGTVDNVAVAAAHDGSRLFVRLEWADSETPNTEFQDAAAVFSPSNGDAAVETFGSIDAPVSLTYWQANLPAALALQGTGPGAFHRQESDGAEAEAVLADGRWAVVLAQDLAASAANPRLGVAVWDGANEERAGIGAVTASWIPLEIEN